MIADYRGPTVGECNGRTTRLNVIKLYTNVRPAKQWVDDFQLWDDFPCSSPPCGPPRSDGGIADAGRIDGGITDAGQIDGGIHDAGLPDGGDGGVPTGMTPADGGYSYLARMLGANDVAPIIDGDIKEFESLPFMELRDPGLQSIGRVWLTWSSDALYVAARVDDKTLLATAAERDGALWNDDSLELMFGIQNHRSEEELRSSDEYKFFVNLLNTQLDARGGGFWQTWDTEWESAVKLTGSVNQVSDVDEGYAVELRIPWSPWGISAPAIGARWAFDAVLNDAQPSQNRKFAVWSNTTGGTINDSNGWGFLEFGPERMPPDEQKPRGCGCSADVLGVIAVPALVLLSLRLRRRRRT